MDKCAICSNIILDDEEIVIIGNDQGQRFGCHTYCAEEMITSGKIKIRETIELSDITDESNEIATPSRDLSEDILEAQDTWIPKKSQSLQKMNISQIAVKFDEIYIKETRKNDDNSISSYDFSEDTTTEDQRIPLLKRKNKYIIHYVIIGSLSLIIVILCVWMGICFNIPFSHNITWCPNHI